MRRFLLGVIVVLTLFVSVAFADTIPGMVDVKSKGKTIITKKIDGNVIKVTIETGHIKKENLTKEELKFLIVGAFCFEFSGRACSVVQKLEIYINDKQVLVPVFVLFDLYEPHYAKIEKVDKDYMLVIDGSDAVASYEVKIRFDGEGVKYKAWIDGESEGTIYETNYYRVVM